MAGRARGLRPTRRAGRRCATCASGSTEAIEPLRREKIMRSGLEAEVTVPADAVPEGFSDDDLAELFITGTVTRGQATLTVDRAPTTTNAAAAGACCPK